ncbi:hypothetical protein GOBAR_DD20434 [Gossypium barbadense]|nr:hypothetical protein GOBAR_DD20434 [Gossypium barbadense]
MRRCPHLRLKFLAATATADTAAMSSYQRPHRGGRNQWGRSFSDRTNSGGRGHLVTGDSNLDSVGEANLGFRRGNFSNQNSFQSQQFGYNPRPSSPYSQNQQFFRQPPPARPYNRYQPPRHPFGQNPAAKPFRPRNSKPWDYREWKYAGTPPPPRSDKFVVLSYNVLADYLASTHRFHDMEEQLNSMGYNGIWKMRTGRAVDGCAIFWRTSRFKLLHEESIEFNKHELRDNVAQICVLELLSQSPPQNTAAPLRSSTNSNKVVICNIHVLYNPRRGEIKLGQVRRLQERAHSVSKSWDNAPVVLCGDFNCTPKSPLYNFISEQKLDLSEVNRDKVSGQASAEIPLQTYNPNSGAQSGNIPAQVPPAVDIKRIGVDKNDSHSDTKKQNNLDRNMKDATVNMSGSSETMQDLSDMSCNNLRMGGNDSAEYDEVTEIQCGAVDMQRLSPGHSSCPENMCSGITEMEHIGTDVTIHSNNGKALDDIVMNNHSNGITTDPELLSTSQSETSSTEPLYQTHSLDAIEVSPHILACQLSESVANDHRDRRPVPSQVDFSGQSDSPGTRDSYGEPLVTSYNRRFSGTVDYIWRSEGLQTVRVLAPIPKHAMQWTPGFPTKKWGSDHIALAAELAFTKSLTNQDPKS